MDSPCRKEYERLARLTLMTMLCALVTSARVNVCNCRGPYLITGASGFGLGLTGQPQAGRSYP
ncbi:hypothetical protein RSAG8_04246, partial [Rhizoctonia solani AG-8 WAC10335]